MQPKTLAPCGADETKQSGLTRDAHVSTISPAPRGSSDAVTEAHEMPNTYINGLEHDDLEVEKFLMVCRKELKDFPRSAIDPPSNQVPGRGYVTIKTHGTLGEIHVTPETAEIIRREGIAA
jgi:hypothetical protein